MASTMPSINNCTITNLQSNKLLVFKYQNQSMRKQSFKFLRIRASSDSQEDCNVEECAPDKEVGKVSMEWVAEERTKVVGTYPPRKKGWTGYVKKDTAGQTNIYSVEPAIYVAESAISSGNAGSSSDGSENTAGVAAFVALVCVAAASSILLQVGKNSPQVQTVEYSGPSLSYYISKFKPPEIIQASEPTEAIPVQPESSAPEVSGVPAPEVSEVPAPEVSEVPAPEVSEVPAPEVSEVQPQSALLDTEVSSSSSS